jgi:hypothetical protein
MENYLLLILWLVVAFAPVEGDVVRRYRQMGVDMSKREATISTLPFRGMLLAVLTFYCVKQFGFNEVTAWTLSAAVGLWMAVKLFRVFQAK